MREEGRVRDLSLPRAAASIAVPCNGSGIAAVTGVSAGCVLTSFTAARVIWGPDWGIIWSSTFMAPASSSCPWS